MTPLPTQEKNTQMTGFTFRNHGDQKEVAQLE